MVRILCNVYEAEDNEELYEYYNGDILKVILVKKSSWRNLLIILYYLLKENTDI